MSEEPKSISQKFWQRLRRFIAVVFLLAAVACIAAALSALATDGWRHIKEDLRFIAWVSVIGAACGVIVLYPIPRFIGRLILRFMRALFTRRFWKWTLIVLTCLAVLAAIFYVEEDLRGKWAWEKFKRTYEAKSEPLDLASFIPPPVPDDQNFALAPIIASGYAEWLDGHGHRIKPPKKDVINRLEMKIGGRKDIWEGNTNTLGNWQKAVKINLKGWQEYYRTPTDTNYYTAGTNEFPVAPSPQTPAADVLLALSKYDSVVEELRQAASKLQGSRFPLNYESASPTEILFPHLYAFEDCAQVLQMRAVAELENNQSEKAGADVKLMLRLNDSIRTEPFLYSHLVRIRLVSSTMQPIWEGLVEHKWSDTQLVELEQVLGKLDLISDYQFAIRGERARNIATIEFMRRNRSRAMNCIHLITNVGRPERYDPSDDMDEYRALPFLTVLISHSIPSGWFNQNKITIVRMYEQFLPMITDDRNKAAFIVALSHATNVFETEREHRSPYNAIALMICSRVVHLSKRFTFAQESVDLARVACALERHRIAHGEYPETLDALVPQFIEKLPQDIINGQPLRYHRTDKEQFVLYSVGWNETDDGGIVVSNDSGPWVNIEKGDWVWSSSTP